MVLPANIYNPRSHVRLDFANYDTDVRFTNYYMGKYNFCSTLALGYATKIWGDVFPAS